MNVAVAYLKEIRLWTETWDLATVTLASFFVGLAVHYLMISGSLRRIRKHKKAHRLIKGLYKRKARLLYGTLSLAYGLTGVGAIVVVWFWPDRIPEPWDTLTLLMFAAVFFLLSGYVYTVGLLKASILAVRSVMDRPAEERR